jgi:hypothetical protein
MTARVIASVSSARPAAERPTRPLPRKPARRAIASARPTGEQPPDLRGHARLEPHILRGPAVAVPVPAAQPGVLVGEALLLGLAQRWLLGEDALPFVAPPVPAPADDHGRQAARLAGAAGQRGVTRRDENQVVKVGAGQAQRTRLVHDEEVPGAVALGARPVLDRRDGHEVGGLARALRIPFWRGACP